MQPDGGGAAGPTGAPAAPAAASTTVGGLKPLAGGGGDRPPVGPDGGAQRGPAQRPKKKMVIKPFKVQPKLPDNFEDATWEKLRVRVYEGIWMAKTKRGSAPTLFM
jgi:hypothetical protein